MATNTFLELTGDPFVDAGGYVLKFLQNEPHLGEKDVHGLIEYATDIYIDSWGGNLHAFFLNSPITQAQFRGDQKKRETLKYYHSLLDDTSPFKVGYCRISGRQTHLFAAGRDKYILSGSGTYLNFHHSFEEGLMLSKEVLIRTFFAPFGLMQLSDKIALISSNDERISEFFVRQNCRANVRDLASGISASILKSPFNNPSSAIFNFVDECLRQLRSIFFDGANKVAENAPSLTLYHFTNFAAAPDIAIHTLTSQVFKFYIYCTSSHLAPAWLKFVKAHYRNSKAKAVFNSETEVWEGKETFNYDDFRTWRNEILETLVNGSSILHHMARWSRYHPFPFKIAETYQTLVRNMEKRTLEKIRHIADFIVAHREADFIQNCIRRLHRAKSANEVRLFALRLTEQNYHQDGKEPLVTLDDCAEYLFPDGGNWREIRDLLLIAIYERLHELKLKVAAEPMDDENELITEN